MAKIKITEAQAKMLQNLEFSKPRKVLKISEEQFNRLFSNLNESEKLTGHPVAGDGGSEYNPQSEEENERTQQSFNESVSEEVSTVISKEQFKSEFMNLIKSIIASPEPEISKFWYDLGLDWSSVKKLLTSHGFYKNLEETDGREELLGKDKFLSVAKSEMSKLYDTLVNNKKQQDTIALGDDIELTERDGDYPVGVGNNSWEPWNREDNPEEPSQELIVPQQKPFKLVYWNPEDDYLGIFKHKNDLFAHIGGYTNYEEIGKYCENEYEPDGTCLSNYVNDLFNKGVFKAKTYGEGFHENMLTLIDSNVKKELLSRYPNPKLDSILGSVTEADVDIEETTTTGSVGGSYVMPKIWAKSPKDMKFGKKPMYKQGKIVEDDPNSNEEKPKRGPKPLSNEDRKLDAIVKALYKYYPELKNHKYNLSFVIGDTLSKLALGLDEKVNRAGQVEFDDCTKLNNNKVAQNGGCSVGAVDNVVKVREGLDYDALIKAVSERTGRPIQEVKTIIENHSKL